MEPIYEITNIEREAGLLDADKERIGQRYLIGTLSENYRAILVTVEDENYALITTGVRKIIGQKGDEGIVFTTKNTKYTLRKVVA